MSDFTLLLAEEMKVTRRTVNRWCEDRKVPGAYRTKGGHWRLRKPRRVKGYDREIAEFVLRYTCKTGYWRPLKEDWDEKLLNYVNEWVHRQASNPTSLSAETLERMRKPLERATSILQWRIEEEMDLLTASKAFNDALEFSTVAQEIFDDDMPKNMRDYKSWMRLNERDPKRFKFLIETPILDMIHPRAYEATAKKNGMLMVKAAKLRLNGCEVTPHALSRELKLSVTTLYRRYGREMVKKACRPAAEYAEAPLATQYKL